MWKTHLFNFFLTLREEYLDVPYFTVVTHNFTRTPVHELLETYIEFNTDVIPFISREKLSSPKNTWLRTELGKQLGFKDIVWANEVKMIGYTKQHISEQFQINTKDLNNLYIYAIWVNTPAAKKQYSTHLPSFRALLNGNTRDYWKNIEPPDNKRLNNHVEIISELFPENNYIFNSCLFGSMSLAIYNIVSDEDKRPRDIDMWMNYEHILDVKYVNTVKKEMGPFLDIYDTQEFWKDPQETLKNKQQNISMTEKHFRFFQGMIQAPLGTSYTVSPNNVSIKNYSQSLPKQKLQKRGPEDNDIRFKIKSVSDIIYNPHFYLYWHGHKFISIIPEIIRKHLRYLEHYESGKLLAKDISDFKIINQKIVQNKIKFLNWSADNLLKFTALDSYINIPIFNFNIELNLTNNIPAQRIRKPSREVNKYIMSIITKKYPELIEIAYSSDKIFSGQTKYRITHIYFEKHASSITHRNDLSSMRGFIHEHLFRNILFTSLPKTPIKSIFGDLPSTWLWVLTSRGTFDVSLVTSSIELFYKHAALLPDEKVIMAGECYVDKENVIWISFFSGSFQAYYIDYLGLDYWPVYKKLFVEFIRYQVQKDVLFKNKRQLNIVDTDLIPPYYPSKGEWALYCQPEVAADRLYNDVVSTDKLYLTQDEFDHIKYKPHLCDKLNPSSRMGYDYMKRVDEDLQKEYKSTYILSKTK